MKKLIIIILISFLISCQSTKTISGTWIGTSSYSTKQPTLKFGLNGNIVSFNNGEYNAFCFECIPQNTTGTYKVESDKIVYNKELKNYETIKKYSKDSISIIGNSNLNKIGAFGAISESNNVTYYKIPEKLKNQDNYVTLSGSKFSINYSKKNKDFQKILEFKNDSILYEYTDNGKYIRKLSYKTISFEGYSVIFIGLSSPFIIKSVDDSKINAVLFNREPQEIELVKLNKYVYQQYCMKNLNKK
ncbi:hypothetical protein [Lacinutrix salivirga]